ncbi:MAG: hypothetical protein RR846_07715 [Oscillospiraceae bacterium]
MADTHPFTRAKWIDCAKFVAICGVLADHCNGFLYGNQDIARVSYGAVGLFVLLAGVTGWLSYEKSQILFSPTRHLKKAFKLFLSYMGAVAVYQIANEGQFSLGQYLTNVLSFEYVSLFYFVFFFLQLILVGSVLTWWVGFCAARPRPVLWQLATIIGLFPLSFYLILHAHTLPIHGGGRYLFGGTYLFLYYIGILLGSSRAFQLSKKCCFVCLFLTLSAWELWRRLFLRAEASFDLPLDPFWFDGINPPGIIYIVFSLLTLFVCYSFFSLAQLAKSRIVRIALGVVSYFGSKTWYIFLYHMLLLTPFLSGKLPIESMGLRRVIVVSTIVGLPSLALSILQFTKKKLSFYWGALGDKLTKIMA